MPQYWISCLSQQKFETDSQIDFSVDGYREREFRRVLQIEPGDMLVYYIKRLGVFAAICQARGRCYVDWGRVWQDDTYPCRFERYPLVILPWRKMLPVKSVLPQLSFLHPKNWGLSLASALKQIPQADFELIEREMSRLGEGL